jgi:hypothetical protein
MYGFSLVDKLWRQYTHFMNSLFFWLMHCPTVEFNMENLSPIVWNDEAFKNLVMDPDRKTLVQGLVTSHGRGSPTDFVQGKSLGLVINLSGNQSTCKRGFELIFGENCHRSTWRRQDFHSRSH